MGVRDTEHFYSHGNAPYDKPHYEEWGSSHIAFRLGEMPAFVMGAVPLHRVLRMTNPILIEWGSL